MPTRISPAKSFVRNEEERQILIWRSWTSQECTVARAEPKPHLGSHRLRNVRVLGSARR